MRRSRSRTPPWRKAAALGHELGTGFHIHVAEAQSDQQYSRSRTTDLRVVESLNKFGILGPRSIAAHCVHVNRREMDLLSETQTAVVHNPQSNLNNAVGMADVVSMAKRHVLVGLGTDAMTTNMLEELRVAVVGPAPSAPTTPPWDSPRWYRRSSSTIPKSPRRVFSLPLGELREGCVGDIVLIDYDPPTPLDASNASGHWVFGISQAAVDTTIVGGNVLMENKRLTLDLDEPRINARARELAAKLWKRL